jgi:hypothetical protein
MARLTETFWFFPRANQIAEQNSASFRTHHGSPDYDCGNNSETGL